MWCVWLGLIAMLAVGCGSHASVTGGRGDLPRCVDAHPAAIKPMPRVPVRNERFTGTFRLDQGALRIQPTDRAAGISYEQARCTLLSADTVEGLPLTDEMADPTGMSIGLGVVAVRSGPGTPSPSGDGQADPPVLRPFRQRLVWAAVLRPDMAANCPSGAPGHEWRRKPTPRDVTGDQVLLLDARTGATGMIYDARSPGICFGGTQAAHLAPLIQSISVRWTMVHRTGNRATIAASARACDGIDPTANADHFHPGLVRVEVQRPIAPCGSPTRRDLRLFPRTLDEPFPGHLVHAPTGALDVFPR